jgi:hypothetical protein
LLVSASSTEPERLTKLRTNYESAVVRALTPLQRTYVVELEKLKAEFTRTGKLEDALLVDAEIRKLQGPDAPAAQVPHKVQIMKAVWGDIVGKRTEIVTSRLRLLAKPSNGPFDVSVGTLQSDPAPGDAKSLVVTYTVDGKENTKTFREGAVINAQVEFQ